MKRWEELRGYLLAATLGASVLAIAKVTLSPPRTLMQFPTYELPEQIALSNWQFLRSHRTTAQNQRGPALVSSVDDQAIAARHYEYVSNGVPLGIEVRYFVNTYAHVPSIIEDATLLSIKPALRDRKHPELGTYVLYAQRGKIHLSACLDPYGKTSVYDNEMMWNQIRPSVVAQRFFPWLLGQTSLRDLRCLWVDLAMPPQFAKSSALARVSPSALDPDLVDTRPLEDAFVEWVNAWQKHYPKETRP